jgi:RNA polymerase sigma factor (sigma-70 family)
MHKPTPFPTAPAYAAAGGVAMDPATDDGFFEILVRVYDALRTAPSVVARLDARASAIAGDLARRARRRRAQFDLFLREAPPQHAEDLALAVKAQQGNGEAVREIRRRLEPVVVRRIYSYNLGWNEEDLVERVFGRVFDKIATYRGQASLRTWGAIVTLSVLKNYLRTADKEPKHVALDGPATEIADERFGIRPDGVIEQGERQQQLKRFASGIGAVAAEALTPRERRAVFDPITDGVTDVELARALAVEPNALRQIRFRAMKKLRAALLERFGPSFAGAVSEALQPAS